MKTNRSRRGPYAKTAGVRARIIEAATEVFAADSFSGATVRRIADRAGITDRGLAHHFPTKEALLLAVVAEHERRRSAMWDNTSPVTEIASLLHIVDADSRYRPIVEVHLAISVEAASAGHPGHAHYDVRYQTLRDRLTEVFAELESSGSLVSPLTSSELAASLIALSDGLQVQWLYHSEQIPVVPILAGFVRSVMTAETSAEFDTALSATESRAVAAS